MDTQHKSLKIAVIEDHDSLRLLMCQALADMGHTVLSLSSAEEVDDDAGGEIIDLFVIDLNLPGEDGISLARRLRAANPLAGIIIVSARSLLKDRLEGYSQGADIYLTKPIELEELCAAVNALAQRLDRHESILSKSTEGHFVLNSRRLQIYRGDGLAVALTNSEVTLLIALSRAPGQRLPLWQVAEAMNLSLDSSSKSSLEVRIVRLRKKLIEAGADPDCIQSIRREGYQLCISLQVT